MIKTDKNTHGLLIVHTGDGKGKSTAAFGMALRMLAHGRRVGVVQFVKSREHVAERRALERFGDQVDFRVMGEGFSWKTRDPERDRAAALAAWETAQAMITSGDFAMVILDELNIVLRQGHLDVAAVVDALTARPADRHVVITGRGAPDALIAAADLVTDMTLVKHPYKSGIKAQAGVEF